MEEYFTTLNGTLDNDHKLMFLYSDSNEVQLLESTSTYNWLQWLFIICPMNLKGVIPKGSLRPTVAQRDLMYTNSIFNNI